MKVPVSHVVNGLNCKIFGKDRFISGLFYDSRRFQKDFGFIALKGTKEDAHKFLKELYLKGCEVFFIQDESYISGQWNATFVLLEDTRRSMGKIARNFWNGQRPKVWGITGTKGKTSTAKILSSSLTFSGIKTGVLGSVWWKLTTPEIIDTFAIMNHFDYFVMEVTSVSVVQHRIDDIDFQVGVFLGLGHDHLDIHKTMNNYFSAKFAFMEKVNDLAVVYLDEWGKIVEDKLLGKKRLLSFDDNSLKDYSISFQGDDAYSFFEICWRGEKLSFKTRFIGLFNWINFLSSYIILREFGISSGQIIEFFQDVYPPSGRMEVVNLNPYVFVDYAHTPESLESSLQECQRLKDIFNSRVIVVFGCGGDRDKEKRPKMGKLAYDMADVVVITSDNPRSESPESIVQDILSGIRENGGNPDDKKIFVELDRKKAIFKALEVSGKNDVVLIAGKGHESYQIIGNKVFPFSDRKVVEEFFLSSHT